jgi:hypothetical protein
MSNASIKRKRIVNRSELCAGKDEPCRQAVEETAKIDEQAGNEAFAKKLMQDIQK